MAQRLILTAAAGCCFFLGFESGSYQYVLVKAAAEFKVNAFVMGAFVAVQFLASMISPALCGGLADRYGRKRIFGLFTGIFTLGCLWVFVSKGAAVFALGIFVTGFGYSMCESLASVVAAEETKRCPDGVVNLIQSAFSFGAVTGPWAADFIIRVWRLDWRFVFLTAGVGSGLMAVLLALGRKGASDGRASWSRASEARNRKHRKPGNALDHPFAFGGSLWVLAVLMFGYSMIETGGIYFIGTLQGSLGGGRESAWGISAVWLSMTVGRLIASRIRMKRLPVMAGGFCAASSAILGLSICGSDQAGGAWMMTGLCAAMGMSMGPVWPALVSCAIERYPQKAALAASRMVMAGSAGGAVMPLFMGAVTDAYGVRTAYWMAAAVGAAACGTACLWGLKKTLCKSK